MENRFLRNRDLIPQENLDKLLVIGLGGIGSAIVLAATIMGFKEIFGYDNDLIEEHNFATTLYPMWDTTNDKKEIVINKKKADLAKNLFNQYADNQKSKFKYSTWQPGDLTLPKMIVCTDNMESRLYAFEEWVKLENRELFIDLRMGATTIEIVTIIKNNSEFYKTTWKASHEIEDAPCTMKHTIYTGMIAASYGLSQIQKILVGNFFYPYIKLDLASDMIKTKGGLIKPPDESQQQKE